MHERHGEVPPLPTLAAMVLPLLLQMLGCIITITNECFAVSYSSLLLSCDVVDLDDEAEDFDDADADVGDDGRSVLQRLPDCHGTGPTICLARRFANAAYRKNKS